MPFLGEKWGVDLTFSANHYKKLGWSVIPLLFLSARGAEEDMRYAKALGADDYLLKPIEPEDLLAAVDDWLRIGASRLPHP